MKRFGLATLLLVGCAHLGHRDGPGVAGRRGWRAWLAGDSAAAATAFAAARDDDVRALFGRALLLYERGDWDDAWGRFWEVLERASRRPDDRFAAALADSAAQKLEQLVGEVPGQRAQAAALARLAIARLPLEARRRVWGMRAAYARRLGEEAAARRFDAARGCPGHWFVAGAYGRLPQLDLDTPFAADGDGDRGRLRSRTVRGCGLSIEAERGHPGVLYAVNWFRAARAQTATVIVDGDAPWRLYLDGTPVFDALDYDRAAPRERRLALSLSAGWHRLAVKLAGQGGRAEAELAVLADPPLGVYTGLASAAPRVRAARLPAARPIDSPLPSSAESTDRALLDLLTAQKAYRHGDNDGGEAALARLEQTAPRFAPAWLLLAALRDADPTRPERLARDRSRRALERALALDPTLARARYNLALMEIDADRAREALLQLDRVEAPRSWRFWFARFQALQQRGWQREAELALAEARRRDPEACPALAADAQEHRRRHDLRGALPLAREASRCGDGSDELAETLRGSADLVGAIAEYRRLVALDPGRESWRAGLAETLAQSGDEGGAAVEFERLLRRYPRATHYRRQLADALYAAGRQERARAVIEEGLAELPESEELRRLQAALCDDEGGRCSGALEPFRLDGKQVIAAFEADRGKPRWDSPAVIVLDRTVTRVFSTGARLTLTHNIIRVEDKDAIDKFGEVSIPSAAAILTLRTVKADGSVREPELLAEKDSVSVPDLEPGDYVEFEYVDPAPPPGAFPNGFLDERFFFRSNEAPLYRSEYLVVTPSTMKLQLDRRGEGAPVAQVHDEGNLRVYSFVARAVPQLFPELATAPMAEYLPSVRVGAGLSLQAWKDYLVDGALGTLQRDAELERIAAAVTRGARSAQEKVVAIDGWTRAHVRPGGGLDEAATAIVAQKEGSRVTVEAALLRAAGVPAQVWLLHPARRPELEGPLPDLEGYDEPVLMAAGMTIDPRYRHAPAGFVPPWLRDARGFALVPGALQTGRAGGNNPDERQMTFDITLARDGGAEVRVRETLRGWPAVEWREALEKLPPDRVRPEFEQRTLGINFPGATLESLRWQGQDDDAGPFVVEYRFFAPQLARRAGAALVLPAPFPARLGKRYLGRAKRSTPLYIDYTPPTQLVAHLRPPQGMVADLPAPVRVKTTLGAFTQEAHRRGDEIELTGRFHLNEGRLPASEYQTLVDFAQRVDRAEERAVELRPSPQPR